MNRLIFITTIFILIFSINAVSQTPITVLGADYTQDFNTLPTTGSSTFAQNSTIPGWYGVRTGTGTNILADAGTNTGGNLYSYGVGTTSARSLGSLGSGNTAAGSFFYGGRYLNTTGATLTQIRVRYTGKQWRNSAASAQSLTFSYLIGSPGVTGSLAEFQSAGVPVAALNFTSPITGGTAGSLNGDLPANSVAFDTTIAGISIPNNTEFMLRWSDPDHTGSDHGLAIDDVIVSGNIVSAAGVTISGRVVTAEGQGLRNAVVSVVRANGDGSASTTLTGSFGYYTIDDLDAGATYIVSVGSKRYTFQMPNRVVSLANSASDVDFVANP